MHKCLHFLSFWMFVFGLDIISLVFLNQNIKLLMCQEKKSEATEPHNCIFRRYKLEWWEDHLGNAIVTSTHGKKYTIYTFLPGVCVTGCPFYMAVSRCQETLWFRCERAWECFKLWLWACRWRPQRPLLPRVFKYSTKLSVVVS